MSGNPFDLAFQGFAEPAAEPEVTARRSEPKHPEPPEKLISEPGAYPGISGAQYHGVEICDSPSISASGLIKIEDKSPAHYWEGSPLNPNRKPQAPRTHFAIGHLLHDLLLHKGLLPADYHIVPDGFVRKHVNAWADEIPAYDEAIESGCNILKQSEFDLGRAMAESANRHELAGALLMAGEPEMTLAARDPKTGIWLRAQPDILPTTMEIIPDVKSSINAAPDAYEGSATRYGSFQAAALYLDVIELLHGEAKRRFVHITIEKIPPYLVTIYDLDEGHIDYGRMLNRRSLNLFEACLKAGDWHGYSPPEKPILPLQMSPHKVRQIERRLQSGDLSFDH